ncbi:MAG TPA: alpha-amylase family glycosyl hydrolase [Bryobacteraceae bacterium]|nr:alpha-amylase family glycosyl hydrolase [Bryobacteraceae bacterium]
MATSVWAPDAQSVINAAKSSGAHPSPEDWRDQWIYFLMVDRFHNPAAPPVHAPFDDPDFYGFQGGKFSGVQQQLTYIRQLGAGAIWLSPVLRNFPFDPSTYHGYGIHDFLHAEPRFADDPARADEELRALVDAAHAQGLYVILDIVLNHTGNAFAYQCDPGDVFCQIRQGAESSYHGMPQPVLWRDETGAARPDFTVIEAIPNAPRNALVWPAELQQNRFFRRQGDPQGGGDDTIGDFSVLKQMLTADPDLQRVLIRAYQYVIARFDIDGFRIDTLRYLKGDLPRLFGNAMREFALSIGKKNFFTFGEVFDAQAEDDIARFIGRNTGDASELVGVDAALDYPLYNSLKPIAKGFAPPSAVTTMYNHRKQVERNVLSSHGDATRYFVTFLDNHDVKERLRYVDPNDPHHYDDQVTLALGCLFSLPGIPCLYYGTEQGLHGRGSDPAVREALWGGPGFDPQNPFYQAIHNIAGVRARRPALRYGRFYFRPVSGDGQTFGISPFSPGVLAFSRILNDEEVLVVANTSTDQGQSLEVIVDGQMSVPGASWQALYSNKLLPAQPSPVRQTGPVTVYEIDGSVGSGPLRTLRVSLQPLEVQILAA